MSAATLVCMTNRLIASLPRKERDRILNRCKTVDLVFGAILCEANQLLRYVYFPLTSFISMVAIKGDHHPPLDMGLIGSEGMLGVTLLLGINAAPLHAMVRGAGTALRMTASQFRRECGGSPSLLRILNRYLYVLMAQLSQTAICSCFHGVEMRLARWLLMTHDRAHANHFHLIHQSLADMLGVQRSAITIAAGALQKRKLIRYTRGEINILNRRGLEAASCACYAAVIEDYSRLLV